MAHAEHDEAAEAAWYLPATQAVHALAVGPRPIFHPLDTVDASELHVTMPPALRRTKSGPLMPEYGTPCTVI